MVNSSIFAGTDSTDEMLCMRAAQGDSAAAETLVLRYNWLVRCCSRPLFLMGADHEDLIQEGMLGLTLAIQRYRPERGASFRTYAERCIRNRLITAVRSAASGKHEALNSALPLDAAIEECLSYKGDPETQLVSQAAFQERLGCYQDQLSPLETQVLHLYLQGLSYQEISQQLKRGCKAIDNAVQRIRKKLH